MCRDQPIPIACRLFGLLFSQERFSVAAGKQLALAASGTAGRYVVLYTGTQQEGSMSLADVQVYTTGEPGSLVGALQSAAGAWPMIGRLSYWPGPRPLSCLLWLLGCGGRLPCQFG
jgi:hypothetical protein